MKKVTGYLPLCMDAGDITLRRAPDGDASCPYHVDGDTWLEWLGGSRNMDDIEGARDEWVAVAVDQTGRVEFLDGAGEASAIDAQTLFERAAVEPPIAAPAFAAGQHECGIILAIEDAEQLKLDLGTQDLTDTRALAKGLVDCFFYPLSNIAPAAELSHVEVSTAEDQIFITLGAEIKDPRLLNQMVALAARHSGHDADYVAPTGHEAIFEGWFGSSDAGSPDSFGVAIVDFCSGEDLLHAPGTHETMRLRTHKVASDEDLLRAAERQRLEDEPDLG